MGSRIMHLIIAKRIAEKIGIQDEEAFLLGGVAPDAVYPKNKSHFYSGTEENYSTTVKFDTFLKKYPERTDYVLGYYTHLIADYVWIKGFYFGWLKNRMNADETFYEQYHGDFRLLNAKLLQYYQIESSILDEIKLDSIHDIEEVKVDDVKNFIHYVKGDMDYPQEHLTEELKVFTLLQIIGYLETSIERGVIKLRELGIT
ncbi:zinc dependent phospholipase C family protein [Ornithinibacillus sp. 179-J 7C1 HS]|uniref:zinc dependent phospholipase C family protein n=1 Tax=Ornithinibacillus sp. 179-J 7C1 HS TaxID=3142384 RepID=UPI00399FCE04